MAEILFVRQDEITAIVSATGLLKANNLSDLSNVATARTNLGLGALATVVPGTGIAAALAINVGSAGAPVLFNGAGGTPSSLTLTNATGLPIAGLSGLGTGVAAALAVNVGSAGAFVTFNGALGTPSSGTLTNATGLPVSSGISGLGTGVATALAIAVGSAGAFVTFNGALGSPSSVGTLPAHTLGGNISGGGNQINNIVIGASTPLAGTFTTVTAASHFGGSAVGSTATLNGTSNGAPASAFVNLQSNNQNVSIGNIAPKTQLDINANLSQSPALISSTSQLRLQPADAASGGTEWVSYGGSGIFLIGATSNGTAASPTATTAGTSMFNFRAYGHNGTSFQLGSQILQVADTLWSGTNQGTRIDFYVTPSTSTTMSRRAILQASGGFSLDTSTDPGAGSLIANKFVQTVATTVAGLPTCNAATKGARMFVTDANANTFHTTAAGGGANNVGVTCDGTNWYIS